MPFKQSPENALNLFAQGDPEQILLFSFRQALEVAKEKDHGQLTQRINELEAKHAEILKQLESKPKDKQLQTERIDCLNELTKLAWGRGFMEDEEMDAALAYQWPNGL